jgi:hypothetical protein
MKTILLSMLTFLLVNVCSGQTREIAFKSHSGNMQAFKLAVQNGLLDESDFGLPPSEVYSYRLDSVIYISESLAIIISTQFVREFSTPADSAKFFRVKKDSVYNSQIWSQRHSLDSIRTVLKEENYYINSKNLNKVIFVGYDNKKPALKQQKPKANVIPAVTTIQGNNNDSLPGATMPSTVFDYQLLFMIAAIFLVSFVGGWVSWRYLQPAMQ